MTSALQSPQALDLDEPRAPVRAATSWNETQAAANSNHRYDAGTSVHAGTDQAAAINNYRHDLSMSGHAGTDQTTGLALPPPTAQRQPSHDTAMPVTLPPPATHTSRRSSYDKEKILPEKAATETTPGPYYDHQHREPRQQRSHSYPYVDAHTHTYNPYAYAYTPTSYPTHPTYYPDEKAAAAASAAVPEDVEAQAFDHDRSDHYYGSSPAPRRPRMSRPADVAGSILSTCGAAYGALHRGLGASLSTVGGDRGVLQAVGRRMGDVGTAVEMGLGQIAGGLRRRGSVLPGAGGSGKMGV